MILKFFLLILSVTSSSLVEKAYNSDCKKNLNKYMVSLVAQNLITKFCSLITKF